MAPNGKEVQPAPSFVKSPYYAVYSKLIENNSNYRGILSKFIGSKEFNISLKYTNDENFVSKGNIATTKGSITAKNTLYEDGSSERTEITGSALSTSFRKDQLKMQMDEKKYERTEIAMAGSMIHEALHGLIQTTLEEDDSKHNTHSQYHQAYLSALKEYNDDNKLGYSELQLVDLSFEGSNSADLFINYLVELSEKNGTTVNEELKDYKVRLGKIAYKEIEKGPKN